MEDWSVTSFMTYLILPFALVARTTPALGFQPELSTTRPNSNQVSSCSTLQSVTACTPQL